MKWPGACDEHRNSKVAIRRPRRVCSRPRGSCPEARRPSRPVDAARELATRQLALLTVLELQLAESAEPRPRSRACARRRRARPAEALSGRLVGEPGTGRPRGDNRRGRAARAVALRARFQSLRATQRVRGPDKRRSRFRRDGVDRRARGVRALVAAAPTARRAHRGVPTMAQRSRRAAAARRHTITRAWRRSLSLERRCGSLTAAPDVRALIASHARAPYAATARAAGDFAPGGVAATACAGAARPPSAAGMPCGFFEDRGDLARRSAPLFARRLLRRGQALLADEAPPVTSRRAPLARSCARR